MRFFQRALLALWIVAVVALAGCANTAAKRTANGLELDLKADQKQGFAVLRVIALRPISLLNPKWQSIEVRTANDQRDEMLDITAPSNAFFFGKYYPTESLYFSKLEAGKYDVTGFGSTGPGPGLLLAMMMSDRSDSRSKLPSFTVEAGRLTNLGTIVFAPAIKDERDSKLFLLKGNLGKQAALEALQSEAKRTDIPLIEGGSWTNLNVAETDEQLLAEARDYASMLYVRPSQNGFTAGSHLGQIFRRTAPGNLERETVDTLGTIFSAAQTADGKWIAGGEYGTYYVRGANGTWQRHRLPGDNGRIVYIEPRGASGALLVSTEARQSRFWSRDSFADAAEVPREKVKVAAMPDALLSTPGEWLIPGNIPGISRETEITRVQKSDFSTRKQSENFWVVDWQMLPGGQLMLVRQNGLSAYPSRSKDAGKTWDHGQKSGGISTYWQTDQKAYSIDARPGFSTVDNLLMKSTDGGQSFQLVGAALETRDFAGRIIYADDAEVLVQGSNMLFSSRDEGKTWTRLLPRK